jgi:hypothetical protein
MARSRRAEQATFASEFVGLILATWDFYMKRVSQSFVESHGFFSGAPVSSHMESWMR